MNLWVQFVGQVIQINSVYHRASMAGGIVKRKWDRIRIHIYNFLTYWPWDLYKWKQLRKKIYKLEEKLFPQED